MLEMKCHVGTTLTEKEASTSSHSRIVSQENEENVWEQGAGMWMYQPVPETACVFKKDGWIPGEKFIRSAKAETERNFRAVGRRPSVSILDFLI